MPVVVILEVLTCSSRTVVARPRLLTRWGPERTQRGSALNRYSIQVGIGREPIKRFNEEWPVDLADITVQARKAAALVRSCRAARAQRLLPPERVYPVGPGVAGRPEIGGSPRAVRAVRYVPVRSAPPDQRRRRLRQAGRPRPRRAPAPTGRELTLRTDISA
ncbi:DUF4291 family protein [Streptomyces clavuligerus]|uniref:Uncharacterized protein n=1 Tax=Streptomyces clavuligerus TaxID=1901 RepID=D5SI68_STRCL|nr:DUF4291 family protein [Streptomyces clavuligerus]EFG03611.1 Hypothetical protein SCLAV_p0120 [Streptomyces clavuligerus]MBY6307819.1 DUF4291 family protein [Streptomyces clavuligerus]QCS10876.1 DUF4291 domain-containing protein [Streptomyces clavuligerus]QPJ98323.1 DUF4291 family protein [Streptomyces clavuligerus]WDN56349.1 DUF4291 domain-containing protein [Streptomyces clavuligerus]